MRWYNPPKPKCRQSRTRDRALLPRLLPEAPAQDVAAWNKHEVQWQKTHPNGPDYAPPEYIAYADVKIEPASSTPYRFAVTYHYDPASGTLTSVESRERPDGLRVLAGRGGE